MDAHAALKSKWRHIQGWRRLSRTLFFALFLLAPTLDILRMDLLEGHLVLFGHTYASALADFLLMAETSPAEAAWGILIYILIPLVALAVGVLWITFYYGRLYCGWLCPHFSVVEWINGLMERALGKPTLWEQAEQKPHQKALWLSITLGASLLMAFTWALSLLTYLLPPQLIFNNLWTGQLSFNQTLFLSVGTALFMIDFVFARHLFCRFGCAVGIAQSIAWMSNPSAKTPTLRLKASAACSGCVQACDNACPMRLNPRSGKRRINTCTQCGLCMQGCADVRGDAPLGAPLVWHRGEEVASRDASLFIHKKRK
ncbi:4Fe-4S binding protein [Magnetococcus sp. PR-3]|uniref:4Fe-4S binding protein n=1 Tax=Magnetococcus sp. PR-3 TaxID=3120355 RepID=UPI002FCDF5F3